MKLCEGLPNAVTANGKTYRVDLDFRRVFMLMQAVRQKDILPGARVYRALRCVMRRPPCDDAKAAAVLIELQKMLFTGKTAAGGGQKLTDFEQDADLIRAAFWQAYGVNLWRDKLHWFEFSALLAGLPNGSRYVDILGIRARPMPEVTKYNAKEREALARAKAACALRVPENEREANIQHGLRVMAEQLLMMAGDKDNG